MRVHRLGRCLLSLLLVATVAAPAMADAAKLRIGYQKGATLIILKAHGTVEKRLALQGVAVEWVEFAAGPVLLEALGAASIDFGMTGKAPPIVAQAAGAAARQRRVRRHRGRDHRAFDAARRSRRRATYATTR
jgi:sulfonate transport system substrate-binding protein